MGSVKLYYLADTNKMVEGCFPDKSVQHWRKDEDFAALEENHAAEVSALRERVAELEDQWDKLAQGIVDLNETNDSLRAQLEAAKENWHQAEQDVARLQKHLERYQLTAQPDGVLEMHKAPLDGTNVLLHTKDGLTVRAYYDQHYESWIDGAGTYRGPLAVLGWSSLPALTTPAASTPPEGEVREALADHEHHRWSKWMAYLFSKCVQHPDGSKTIPAEWAHRWMLQTMTPYRDLTEREKDSDRAEVDEAEAVRSQALAAPAPAPRQVTHVCEGCDMEWHTGKAVTEGHTCPDCNDGEGE